jgi:cell wall-associated NlpC family hydrolase
MSQRHLLSLLIVSLLSACQGSHNPSAARSPSSVSASQSLAIAESYRIHRWIGSERNIKHGLDTKGIRIDTPDIGFNPPGAIPGWWQPGIESEGIPYQWGGFATPAQFDAGIAKGLAAGDVYTTAKRQALDDAVSTQATGIDCSGYISRCWRLPRSYSTRELPALCDEIKWPDLRPGDLLNITNSHCLLVAGWQDPGQQEVLVYETGCPPTWKAMRHPINAAWLRSLGYRAYRYRGMVTNE